MKAQLKMKKHRILKGEHVFEIWYGDELIGEVTGADGPGVRVISKYKLGTQLGNKPPIAVVEVMMLDTDRPAPFDQMLENIKTEVQ